VLLIYNVLFRLYIFGLCSSIMSWFLPLTKMIACLRLAPLQSLPKLNISNLEWNIFLIFICTECSYHHINSHLQNLQTVDIRPVPHNFGPDPKMSTDGSGRKRKQCKNLVTERKKCKIISKVKFESYRNSNFESRYCICYSL
jgi:hypothetical protein